MGVPHYFMNESIRRQGLAVWLSKGGRRRAAIRDAVRARAAGRCETCGDEVDMHDGRSNYGGTYALLDQSAPIVSENVVIVHRGCAVGGG